MWLVDDDNPWGRCTDQSVFASGNNITASNVDNVETKMAWHRFSFIPDINFIRPRAHAICSHSSLRAVLPLDLG